MEECESLATEMTELQELQSEASEAVSQDDEDELEELQNSLREVVQDQSVKPKLQCLMVDPSFSMVTVQSEDSGIVWETASSRCSTPWASETSSISEAYSMDGSGAAGKITIIFDEEKIVRRRIRSGGRSSRLGDRLSRAGSSRSASALGVERPEMMEVSLPNVKGEKTETEPDLEEIKNKDQQLFSLISEGYEILNIRVPSKLPTVDEEESTELHDNLSYLDQTPQIRSRNHHDWTPNHVLPEEGEVLDHQEDSSQPSADTEAGHTPTQKESTSDFDYFENFTLLDHAVPAEQVPELQQENLQPPVKPQAEEQTPTKETVTDIPSASEDSFVFVTDVDIVGEHLDEVFYGEGSPADAPQRKDDDEADGGVRMRMRRESQRTMKEGGSVLFGSEETTLTPIYISPGPPKIIDPILLEEPTAMSFMYSDLYEDAVGQRQRSDEEYSEAESVTSEKSYKRRFSDSDEAEGYLEKFILKDETSTVEAQPESVKDKREGRMMFLHSKFEMTGCLTRMVEEAEIDKTKTEEPKIQEVRAGDRSDDVQSATFEEEIEVEKLSMLTGEQDGAEASEESVQGFKLTEDKEMKHEVKRDQAEPQSSSTDEPLPDIQEVEKEVEQKERESEEHQREEHKQSEQSLTETKQPCQTQEEAEKMPEGLVEATDETAPESNEVPQTDVQSEIQSETSEKSLSEEAAADTKMEAADEKTTTEAKPEVVVEEDIITLTETSGEMKTSAVTSPCEETEDIPEDVGPVEVITDRDSAVQAVVEVTEKAVNETEIQTQVQIDLQEATHDDTTDVPTATVEAAAKSQSPEFVAEAHQESEVKTEISSEVAGPVIPEEVETDSDEKHREIVEALQQQPEESMTEVKAKTPTDDTGTVVQDMVSVGDELILLVPKGQAVEMDIDISQWSDKTPSDAQALPEPDSVYEHLVASEDTPMPIKETKTETQLELEPVVYEKVEEPLENDLDRAYSPPAPVEDVDTEEKKTEEDVDEDEGVFSPLRTFTPLEDLSPEEPDVELKAEVNEAADAPEAIIIIQDVAPDVDLQREDTEQKMEQDEVVEEAPEAPVEELEYEVISKQDAEEMPESETQRDAEESRPESGQSREERRGVEMEMEEEKVSPEEELIEADYDIIDAEEENQARLAAELQGMDWFCLTCGCLLPEDDCESGKHQSHEVTSVDKAYEEIKEKLSDWISELQGRSENIEDLVSELELAYNTVEDQCVDGEVAMQAQNEEMMALVMEQYNNMSVSMEEEKKAKLEQLYDQIVSFQESIDTTKATLETTAREAETDARSPEDIRERLEAALDSAMSLELGPKGLLVFEDYAKGNTSSSHVEHRKGIPVPQRPTLQHQEPGSATSTSVTVYWKVNPGDIIDCFQVYCMEDPHGAVSEEYRVTVKESYCVLEELEPDKTYKVWVMAVNYTGCSLPSERLAFTTAPSVPVIDTERCTIMWDSATLRWQKQTPGQSYTLEYCRQYDLEGEGLRTISGIRICEQRVLLQPNENYLFYIKAVNEAGASEQSEAALISTKGTRFHLLKASAHPALELSEDQTALHYSQDTHEYMPHADKQFPSVLGELLSARGRYYWETIVSGSTAYRLGVAYSAANRDSSLGENSQSWCLQCVPTPSGCRYQLLHNHVQSSVFVIDMPERVGTLLDYQLGRLSFYNPLSGQMLGTFSQRFTQPCHPALALEMPGSLEVRMVLDVPEFTKDS
ncbi:cardiomyopathy-associated protein 5 isoform X2 [Hippoglossus hippoglossus]|uniref:cardiomyopathy-associated protein 5 isoform X1 n=1 Tax=Hippoglossus hippoglossus TaxID=8267 RepID=UPI00148C12E6|nr:cardiomyopathy-associated protein 5 isoform X1 [Hippoglossus hippoglossus]XP_034450541.1 cardiomyopathy-associated protein 5 isoform X2 [Hippoglossus hippoglossus]